MIKLPAYDELIEIANLYAVAETLLNC